MTGDGGVWNDVSGRKVWSGMRASQTGYRELFRLSERKFKREGEGEELWPRGVEAFARS